MVKSKTIERAKQRYASDSLDRRQRNTYKKRKYNEDPKVKAQATKRAKRSYDSVKKQKQQTQSSVNSSTKSKQKTIYNLADANAVRDSFLQAVRQGPDFVCASCFRLRFRKQVIQCHKEKYDVKQLADRAISDKFVHSCDENCTEPCNKKLGPRGKLYICLTCDRHLSNGKLPPECSANGLELDEIPDELAKLNVLERHLIARRIPFMKILTLPKGGQKSILGPVTCVPCNIEKTRETLPRAIHDSDVILVALKRKLEYKGNYERQLVDLTLIEQCLGILKSQNEHYKDIDIQVLRSASPCDSNSEELATDSRLYDDVYMSFVNPDSFVPIFETCDNSSQFQSHTRNATKSAASNTEGSTPPGNSGYLSTSADKPP